MSIQIKPGYTNPLAAMERNKANRNQNQQISQKPGDNSDTVSSLQNKQQQLQNEMLLIKAVGADTGQNSAETLKNMEEKLEEITNTLRTAKANPYASSPSMSERLLTSSSRSWRA